MKKKGYVEFYYFILNWKTAFGDLFYFVASNTEAITLTQKPYKKYI